MASEKLKQPEVYIIQTEPSEKSTEQKHVGISIEKWLDSNSFLFIQWSSWSNITFCSSICKRKTWTCSYIYGCSAHGADVSIHFHQASHWLHLRLLQQTQIHHLCPDHPQYDVLFLDACSPQARLGQADTLNISLPLCNDISSGIQCLDDGNRLFYSKITKSTESNRTSVDNEFFMYLIKPNCSVDNFMYCSEQNLSRKNLLDIIKRVNQADTNTLKSNLSDVDISENRRISDFKTYQFWTFAFLFTFSSICTNAIFTLSDTACCETIQKTGAVFGRQRMWGSIGWGIIAPVAGLLNDYTGDFLAAWILMATSLLLFLWNISKLDLTKPQFSKNILRDVGIVLRSKEFLAYEAVILMNGLGTGLIWFYLIWFLRTIGGSELLCGLCLTVQSFGGAIPLMFFSGWIIRKCGHFQLLSLSLLTYIIRFLYYSQLYRPWWVLPLEFCHGITFGLYYTVIASYGKLSSKPGTEATTQSILFSTHEGLGASIGCVLAGIGFDHLGGHETFFIAGIFFVFGFAISLFLLFFVIQKQKRTYRIPCMSSKSF
ncbi:Major facilitator superfamily like protein [Argiope bruennichi]|uniref:Major facilitator superfamily like protein n=1 Tax=Argiope bruennichi TaxID=94029 RepID=A0A8T0E6T7_ARGBR|nr:Major facilitator superfamily like protein [Argiope bruennichi]